MATRSRNWTFVIYPGESCPENYPELLTKCHVAWVESPLHDRDVYDKSNAEFYDIKDENTGYKKPHRHILVMYSGVKSYDQVMSDLKPLGVTYAQIVGNSKSLVRYFAHLDNPEKAPYDFNDIKFHGGATYDDVISLSSSEINKVLGDIVKWLELNRITEYSKLLYYALENDLSDWMIVLKRQSVVVNCYLSSVRNGGFPSLEDVEVDYNGEVVNG